VRIPVSADPVAGGSLLVSADGGSGRTRLLRQVIGLTVRCRSRCWQAVVTDAELVGSEGTARSPNALSAWRERRTRR